jgi:putative GTP pyrophosphokinase
MTGMNDRRRYRWLFHWRFLSLEITVAFVERHYSKNQINKAGDILIAPETYSDADQEWASQVLANWRACHGYPINTFQATLRQKLKTIDKRAIVAQRLKRAPSIILKLQRFDGMKLARMQDIGGLRAVVRFCREGQKA